MNRRFKLLAVEIILPLLILAAGTYLLRLNELDLRIQGLFYSPSEGWYLSNLGIIRFIYKFSNIPALIISVASLIVFALSFSLHKAKIYRKIALFLLLAMLIGPGLIVNSVFKEHWGRPRPRNVSEFGGRMEYLQLTEKGISGSGKSFPCGHASMGFYFFTLYFLLRRNKRRTANFFLWFAVLSGSAIGFVRVVQGGHFTGDVLWSGGMNYYSVLMLYYLLGLHKSVLMDESHPLKVSKPVTIVLIGIIPILVYVTLIATPFYANRTVTVRFAEGEYHQVLLLFDVADVEIGYADSVYFDYEASGFAFPGAKLVVVEDVRTSNDTVYYSIRLKQKGTFSELHNSVKLFLTDREDIEYDVQVTKGEVWSAY